jgi:hypothetical protein
LNFNGHVSFDTVFANDYQGEQLILRNIHLYPTPLFARIFQNKPRIYIYKYIGNFFVLTDPNNYFFALHPEPLTGEKNIFKYPFVAIVFFLYGLYFISKYRYRKVILVTFVPSVLVLSILKNFEWLSFVLWIPISLVIIHGIEQMYKDHKKLFLTLSILLILFAIPEIIRSFVK